MQGSLQRQSTPTTGKLLGADSFTHNEGAPRGEFKSKSINEEVLDRNFRESCDTLTYGGMTILRTR